MPCLDGDEQQNPVQVRRYHLKRNDYYRVDVFKLLLNMMRLDGNERHDPVGIQRYHLKEQCLLTRYRSRNPFWLLVMIISFAIQRFFVSPLNMHAFQGRTATIPSNTVAN
jgi:hypothetical protein